MTTVQKLKQKPLPGISTFFGVHERMISAVNRYERLLILISQGTQDGEFGQWALEERDSAALRDLTDLAATMDADVQIYHVPGGRKELAKWAAASISRYAVAECDVNLLENETTWERFLRVTGFNAYAALTVLQRIRVKENGPTVSSNFTQPCSTAHQRLFQFLQMGVEERVQRFSGFLGGDRVLRSVSERIDTVWKQDAGSTRLRE